MRIALLSLLLVLAGCGSNADAVAERLRKEEEARKTGYAAWTTRLSARDQALAAARARADEQDPGPPPAADQARNLIQSWLSIHLLEPLEVDSPHLVVAGEAQAVLAGGTSFKAYSWDLAGAPEKVWTIDAALRRPTDLGGAGWHLYTFTLAPGQVKSVTCTGLPAAEDRLKAMLGAKY